MHHSVNKVMKRSSGTNACLMYLERR